MGISGVFHWFIATLKLAYHCNPRSLTILCVRKIPIFQVMCNNDSHHQLLNNYLIRESKRW